MRVRAASQALLGLDESASNRLPTIEGRSQQRLARALPNCLILSLILLRSSHQVMRV